MMQSKSIGQILKELEDDHDLTATMPFPSVGLTLEVQAVAPYLFRVKMTPDGEEPAEGLLPITILGPMILKTSLEDTAKAAAGAESIADEAQEFLRSL